MRSRRERYGFTDFNGIFVVLTSTNSTELTSKLTPVNRFEYISDTLKAI